eukprot:80839_1
MSTLLQNRNEQLKSMTRTKCTETNRRIRRDRSNEIMLSSADCRSFQSFGLFFNGFISIKEYEKPFNMDLFGGSRFIKNTLNEKLNEIKENRKVQSNDTFVVIPIVFVTIIDHIPITCTHSQSR